MSKASQTDGCIPVDQYNQLPSSTEEEKQTQIMTVLPQPSPKLIYEIKLSLLKTYIIPETYFPGYKGCIIHPSGKLILSDRSHSKLIVLNDDGTIDNEITCSSFVNDVTTIDDTTVAVSTYESIDVIDIYSKQKYKVIKTDHAVYGITHHKGALLWCETSKGIQRTDLSDWSITTLVKQDRLPKGSYVTTNEDQIYQTNYQTKTVTCYTIKGDKLWEYKNQPFTKKPSAITVESNCNCYVTSDNDHDVVVISPDGKDAKQLLTWTDGLDRPYGIYYDKTKRNLLIVNAMGPAFLYDVLK